MLFGEYATYFQKLEHDEPADNITDETYLSRIKKTSGYVTSRSPQSSDELSRRSDAELLDYLNEWQNTHCDRHDPFIEITIEALADAFQSVFTESIIPQDDRLEFWIEKNRDRIERPIYIRSIVQAMQEQVKEKNFERLDRWFDFCQWVITHPDEDSAEAIPASDTLRLRENPSWHSARRAVCDFVETCLKEGVAISARERLAGLLKTLCTQSDWSLDRNQPVLLNRNDPLTDAINRTRSRALQHLVNFGCWVRRHDDNAAVPEVASVLESRFKPDAEHPLTIPEYAILGLHYVQIFALNKEWAVDHKSDFFPLSNFPAWHAAFENMLAYNHPYEPIFAIVHDDFEFAIEHLDNLQQEPLSGRAMQDILSEYLFLYYLWDVYPLTGDGSLLERFYQQFNGQRKHWATLFSTAGHLLYNTNRQQFDENLKERTKAFFEWRLEAQEPAELCKFPFWLKAECLEAKWRLEAYDRILDVPGVLDVDQSNHMIVYDSSNTLYAMLQEHPAQVVACFDKLVRLIPQNDSIYIPMDEVKAILKAGLNHNDEGVRKHAESIRENLLHREHFELLDSTD